MNQRLTGAFALLTTHVEEGELSKAFTFFSNIVNTEAQLARENERAVFAQSTIVLDKSEACSE